MDPVNKWLTVIIAFMVALIVVVSYKAGSQRYEMTIQPSSFFENHAIVYVLDTKSGEVKAQLFDENELQYNGNIKSSPQTAFEFDKSRRFGRAY